MRTRLVAGNWKMNGTRASARDLAAAVVAGSGGLQDVEVVLCPPFPHLPVVRESLGEGPVQLGAQNLYPQPDGAYTGEVSAAMLVDAGCRYVLIGHSERRALLGESDEFVAEKASAALAAGLTPILCVGETLAERESGVTDDVVTRQLDAVVRRVGPTLFPATVIAYEPVWAIGTGRTASPDEAQAVHAVIRAALAAVAPEAAGATRVLYGGSVKPDNAARLFAMPDIDGGLIGGAALSADGFLAICGAARTP